MVNEKFDLTPISMEEQRAELNRYAEMNKGSFGYGYKGGGMYGNLGYGKPGVENNYS